MAHDAVQLLDRAMMAPEAPARDCMSAAAPAALHLALCQDGQHSRDALSLQTGISSLTGAAAPPLVSRSPCHSDVRMTLSLYMGGHQHSNACAGGHSQLQRNML